MNFYKLESLSDWHRIPLDEPLTFEADSVRRVRVTAITNAFTEVWAVPVSDSSEKTLVAFDRGQFSIEFTSDGPVDLIFSTQEGGSVFCRGAAPDHRVQGEALESFTNIEPRVRRNTEFDRAMLVMQQNMMQTQKAMAAAYEAKLQATEARLTSAATPAHKTAQPPVVEPETPQNEGVSDE